MTTRPESTVPEPYGDYTQVFSEADSEPMPSHSPQDLAIELLSSKQLPWSLIYNMSQKELDTLSFYIEVQLKHG